MGEQSSTPGDVDIGSWDEQQVANRMREADRVTDLAVERTQLARERTFSAWIRTGLSAMAAGLGIARLLESARRPWLTISIGAIFIIAGAVFYLIALWRYSYARRAMAQVGLPMTPLWLSAGLILALVLSAGLALFLILV